MEGEGLLGQIYDFLVAVTIPEELDRLKTIWKKNRIAWFPEDKVRRYFARREEGGAMTEEEAEEFKRDLMEAQAELDEEEYDSEDEGGLGLVNSDDEDEDEDDGDDTDVANNEDEGEEEGSVCGEGGTGSDLKE